MGLGRKGAFMVVLGETVHFLTDTKVRDRVSGQQFLKGLHFIHTEFHLLTKQAGSPNFEIRFHRNISQAGSFTN